MTCPQHRAPQPGHRLKPCFSQRPSQAFGLLLFMYLFSPLSFTCQGWCWMPGEHGQCGPCPYEAWRTTKCCSHLRPWPSGATTNLQPSFAGRRMNGKLQAELIFPRAWNAHLLNNSEWTFWKSLPLMPWRVVYNTNFGSWVRKTWIGNQSEQQHREPAKFLFLASTPQLLSNGPRPDTVPGFLMPL